MSEQLEEKHLRIIDRATERIRKQYRDDFRKFVFDILRGQQQPTATSTRHAIGAAFCKFGRKL